MLRTLYAALTLLALACTGQQQTHVARPEPVDDGSGPGDSPGPEGTADPEPVVPEGPRCADIGGRCLAQTATAACPEFVEAWDCGSGTGCCIQSKAPDPHGAGCHWTVGGRCFDSAEAACSAAGCALDVCIQSKSLPVQVSCP
jgi:hypothetical protein